MPSYLVTGASRGIGLAIVEELLKDPLNVVIATARNPSGSGGLQNLRKTYPEDRLATIKLEVTDEASVRLAAQAVSTMVPDGLDCIINNAAVSLQPFSLSEECDLDIFEEELRVNVISPMRVLRAFLPLIRRGSGKKVVFVTSDGGSLEYAPRTSAVAHTYSVTKAALNMLARKWGTCLRAEGITTVLLHPGWVDTDMGNTIDTWAQEHLPGIEKLSPQESAVACIRVIKEAKLEEAVGYYSFDGTQIPW